MKVAVIGAGISGLVAAHRLRAAGAEVTVYESTSTVGGKLRTVSLAGQPFDVGAEAFLARRPEAAELAAELDLEVAHPSSARASILAGGKLRPIPAGTVMGVPTSASAVGKVLSTKGMLQLEAERDLPSLALTEDVSVGGLLRERLGSEVVERLVDPLLGGVYAGRADALGLRATMPGLASALGEHGSVLAAAASLMPKTQSGLPVFGAVHGGYGALVSPLDKDVRRNATVHSLRRNGSGWQLSIGSRPNPEHAAADAVVLAVPAPAAAKLLDEAVPVAAQGFSRIELASMVVVGIALPDNAELPDASGVLLASGEQHRDGRPFTAKAFTYSSRKWKHLPAGMLRASVGRFGEAPTLRRDDSELIAAVRADLAELTGITADLVDSVVARWGGGLPQYGVGHADLVEEIENAVAAEPTLAVTGAALHGVGVAPCIATANSAAEKLLLA